MDSGETERLENEIDGEVGRISRPSRDGGGEGGGCNCATRKEKNAFSSTDLERERHVRRIRPTILLPVQPGRGLTRVARVEGDEVVRRREARVLELG